MTEKAVMISIRPEWCSLIAQGKKTVEVRKTRPNQGVPFKCYIYCTRSQKGALDFLEIHGTDGKIRPANQKVIGEFVCDEIHDCRDVNMDDTCITVKDWLNYTKGHDGVVYGWHISDLVIYDKPRWLSEFNVTDNEAVQRCFNRQLAGQPEYVTQHDGWLKGSYICHKNGEPDWCTKCKTKPLQRPPQSWCYVVGGAE